MNKVSDNFTNSQRITNQGFFFQIIKHSNIKYIYTGSDKKNSVKLLKFAYPKFLHVLGAQKNLLIEMVLLSTHNMCFS